MASGRVPLTTDDLGLYAATRLDEGAKEEDVDAQIRSWLSESNWPQEAIELTIGSAAKRAHEIRKGKVPQQAEGQSSQQAGQQPQVQQDNVSQIMTQMMGLLGPMASRLEALERQRTDELHSATTQIRTPAPVPTKSKFPHPEPFDGDRSKYLAFRYKTKAKLRHEYEGALSIAQDRVRKLVGVSGKAADVLLPWAETYQDYSSIDELWHFMDQQYDDPHQKSKALNQLSNLRQGKLLVRDYHMEFNRLKIQLGERFGEAAKKSMFLKGLYTKLQEALATVDEDLLYEQLINKAIQTSDNLYRVSLTAWARQGHTLAEQSTPKTTQREASPKAIDWELTKVGQARLDKSKQEKHQFKCYNCGKSGYIARQCPNIVRARKAAPSPQHQEALEEDSSTDSGKEQL
uniref:Gag protein n=1 Tax=Pyrenophora graminea TaxID=5028 RepID=Q8J138_PYRGR|nr:gag protein [Pyrenophora graminea]